MQRKSVLPFAVVLGIAAVWTMFTRAGKNPLSVNMNPLGKSSTETKMSVTAPASPDATEERIANLFQNDEQLASMAQVHGVHCEGSTCIVEVFVPGNIEILRTRLESLVRANPWLGGWEMKSESANPGIFSVVFHRADP
jgi:hypothetical protein